MAAQPPELIRTYKNGTILEQKFCLTFPPPVFSPGLISLLSHQGHNEIDKPGNLMEYAAPRLQLQMIVIFLLTQAIHCVLKHLRLPVFISQLLAGIILGKNSLITMSEDSVAILGSVASLGYMLFLFLTGVKMDVSMTYRSGKKVICIGILTVVVPLIVCLLMAKSSNMDREEFMENKPVLLAVSYSGTSFPVVHCLLSELKLLNSELGRLGLSAALVGDMLSLFLRTIFSALIEGHGETELKKVARHFGKAILFLVLVFFCFRPLMRWMVRRTHEGEKIKKAYVYTAILAFMVSHKFTEDLRVFFVIGPFLVGLAVPDGPPLGSALVEKLEPVTSGFLMPLYAATCGMRIDFANLRQPSSFAKHQVIAAVVTIIVKFGVSFLVSFLCNIPTRDCLAFAALMISKGVVEMTIYNSMNDAGIIDPDIFTYTTIIIIVIASIVPMLVKTLYDPSRKYACYPKRSIMQCKLNEQLRMISCIHVPVNVNSVIDLINVSCPTTHSPVVLHVLHLIKLSGRATPLFISHEKNWNTLSGSLYSENVILTFNQFEQDNWGAVLVKVFTAVSPPNLMYEDIFNLARDTLTSFILLPFHRQWNVDGSIESEDRSIRSLNYNVLEKSPCSVGILVEGRRRLNLYNSRDHTQSMLDGSSSYGIAVIFLGGKDDREALALGRRMSQDKSVAMTIIHVRAANRTVADDMDTMQDAEMLRNAKETYIEKQVNDGPETLEYLRSIVNDYQLFIVGRRYKREDPQTFGLHEWTEIQEIGIIGDLLSSADFGGNNSVLIVQQQQSIS
ncbi:cation/H+ exchanger 4 [Hibiscus trionum]|uniref:Cation/H+ exchanger 4 n=1 Tax=Hibiscus trionum TaxID=183268 RepID=A0A9W7M984_HIBTR|nr:cation/H+ exchanger 4 [Hibiscus trionum]